MEILYFQKSNVKNYIHLLLSLHIVAMPRLGIVADRYLYLSLSGILLLVSYQITGWLEKKCRVFSKFLLFLSILFYSLYFTIPIITVNNGKTRTP